MPAAPENPTSAPVHKRVTLALLIGAVLTLLALSLPANSEPQTDRVSAFGSASASPFEPQEDTQLRDLLSLAPPPTTAPPTTTTTTHTHPKPVPKPAVAVASSAPSAPAGGCGGWEGLIAVHFPGEVPKACSVMMCESKGNPQAQNSSSSASGLWQFLSSTWESTTGTPAPASQYSAETQTAAAAKLRNSSGWGQWSCS